MPAAPRLPVVAAAAGAADVVLVVVFAAIGRASHGETVDVAGTWETAWPFLVGLVIGWLVARGWRHPLAVRPTGIAAWVSAVVVGMLLRLATGAGAALAFVVVASVTLAAFLLGWRAVVSLVRRARRARRPRRETTTEHGDAAVAP
ncbi:hypothetical protein GCM10017608_22260 [Agromyces luteolus]|uniref:DUF3054 family protein n=1 Tax=Agromyces luteolus TaxID=88373 RepID=A0A7C9HT15_9MICO|nr:DUF3054 domain-containing protein [Agromyces luteolus]MUN08929.1 DUF3054 family protein [Agromyces luteolus]GLK28292.1 hypothetical protein GCM10017608_22260 [Agromyces luteolus]